MNIVHNCLDKYAGTHRWTQRVALRWEGEEGHVRTLTYAELRREVNRPPTPCASLGLGKGDAIGVFMPMTPEIVVAMLAIIKIGGIFLPLFSGFGAQAIVVAAGRCGCARRSSPPTASFGAGSRADETGGRRSRRRRCRRSST